MICGHGEQLKGSFHCIQSWCQYRAGSPGSLVKRIMPPVLAKSPKPICSRARRVGGQSSSFWMVGLSSPRAVTCWPWYLKSGGGTQSSIMRSVSSCNSRKNSSLRMLSTTQNPSRNNCWRFSTASSGVIGNLVESVISTSILIRLGAASGQGAVKAGTQQFG